MRGARPEPVKEISKRRLVQEKGTRRTGVCDEFSSEYKQKQWKNKEHEIQMLEPFKKSPHKQKIAEAIVGDSHENLSKSPTPRGIKKSISGWSE